MKTAETSAAIGKLDSKPRLAVLMRHFSPTAGGAEAYAYRLAEHLRDAYQITAFSQSFGPKIEGIEFVQMPWIRWLPRWLNQWHYSRSTALATCDFDVVHSHENTRHGHVQTLHVQTVRSNLFGPGAKRPAWVSALKLLSSPRLWFYRWVENQRLFHAAQHLVFASAELQRDTHVVFSDAHFPPQSVIRPGTDAPELPNSHDREHAKLAVNSQWPAPNPDQPWLLFVANDWQKKGLPCILKALSSTMGEPLQLLIVGKTEQLGQFQADITAAQAKGALQIHILGPVDNLPTLYQAASLLLHPTTQDAYPMVVLEAFGHGCPVITTAAPFNGLSAEIANGLEATLLADPHDANALREAIQIALTSTPSQQLQAAHTFARSHAWAEVAAQYKRIFESIKNNSAEMNRY